MLSEGQTDGRADKTTIGLTRRAREIAERIKENEGFEDLRDVALIGFTVAVNGGLGSGSARDTSTTWNVGTFDGSGQLRDLVSALFPEVEQPYRQIEYLVNAGLEMLAADYEGAEASTSLVAVLNRIT